MQPNMNGYPPVPPRTPKPSPMPVPNISNSQLPQFSGQTNSPVSFAGNPPVPLRPYSAPVVDHFYKPEQAMRTSDSASDGRLRYSQTGDFDKILAASNPPAKESRLAKALIKVKKPFLTFRGKAKKKRNNSKMNIGIDFFQLHNVHDNYLNPPAPEEHFINTAATKSPMKKLLNAFGRKNRINDFNALSLRPEEDYPQSRPENLDLFMSDGGYNKSQIVREGLGANQNDGFFDSVKPHRFKPTNALHNEVDDDFSLFPKKESEELVFNTQSTNNVMSTHHLFQDPPSAASDDEDEAPPPLPNVPRPKPDMSTLERFYTKQNAQEEPLSNVHARSKEPKRANPKELINNAISKTEQRKKKEKKKTSGSNNNVNKKSESHMADVADEMSKILRKGSAPKPSTVRRNKAGSFTEISVVNQVPAAPKRVPKQTANPELSDLPPAKPRKLSNVEELNILASPATLQRTKTKKGRNGSQASAPLPGHASPPAADRTKYNTQPADALANILMSSATMNRKQKSEQKHEAVKLDNMYAEGNVNNGTETRKNKKKHKKGGGKKVDV